MGVAVNQIWRSTERHGGEQSSRLVRIVRIYPSEIQCRNCDAAGNMRGRTNQIKIDNFPRYYEFVRALP